MKKYTLIVCAACSMLSNTLSVKADTIALWTFEVNTPADTTATAITSILADSGTGTASGVHAGSSAWTTPTGNGSANSLSANTWAVGDYYQFSVSTVGYQDIILSWAQTSSSTGPGEFKLAYQVNGGGFTDYQNYTVLPNQTAAPGVGSWSSTTENPGYNYLVDLSALLAVENVSAVDFRLIMRSTADSTPPGTVASGGTSRVDNFLVSATVIPVPEPSSAVLAAVGGVACLFVFRRRR